ncbi:hypothetical protein [Olsenella sp. DNF00959]|uniref:hypothetical protein n=1 Tax=Olsenella sp. DNF00959 TaxID=1476999 RepID=UPI000784924C|nr:hypothetical protein [Olsenella sp. DNF00959]KXB62417.1 hypothetical protein HMPREF1868_01504 [Olsenella sp. DNF00959]
MLYLGNFSYSDQADSAENYCLMPALVEAADPEEALTKIAHALQELHEGSDLLEGAARINLDSLVELEAAPSEALITQWTKVVPSVDGLSLISSVLPAGSDDAEAYSWVSNDADEAHDHDHDDPYDEDEVDEEVFLSFE